MNKLGLTQVYPGEVLCVIGLTQQQMHEHIMDTLRVDSERTYAYFFQVFPVRFFVHRRKNTK